MTLSLQWDAFLADVLPSYSLSNELLLRCLDLTLLDPNASPEAFTQLQRQAQQYPIAALCVHSQHLSLVKGSYSLATVINFPLGEDNIIKSLSDIELAVAAGATEIDYVLPYQSYLQGNKDNALKACKEMAALCQQESVLLKVIIETGAFPTVDTIYQVGRALLDTGCNFLKTSTGKSTQGATLSAVFALLSAIKEGNQNCGIKVSGGIRTAEQALKYAQLAQIMLNKEPAPDWFRIGTSKLFFS